MFAQLKWGRAGRERSPMAAEPSGLAWLCSARRSPGAWAGSGGRSPPALARGRLSRRECLITMVRRGPLGRPPSSPSALPHVNCHAEAIRAAASSRPPASALPPAPGWLVIDRGGGRGDAPAGRANQWAAPAAQAGPQTLSGTRVTLPSLVRKKSVRGPQGAGKVRASPPLPAFHVPTRPRRSKNSVALTRLGK